MRGEQGATSTELVLVMPAVLMMVLLAVQFGMYLHAAQVVEAAAQEGLEAGRGERDSAAASSARASTFLADTGGVQNAAVTARRDLAQVAVTVTGLAAEVVPGLDLRVTSVAIGPVERFIPEPDRDP